MRGGREGHEWVGRHGEGRKWGGGLVLDICPGAPEFLDTPLSQWHRQDFVTGGK